MNARSALLTPDQLAEADRYELGLERLADTIERLNTIGRGLGLPPIPRLTYYTASSAINKRLQEHYLESIGQMEDACDRAKQKERMAAF